MSSKASIAGRLPVRRGLDESEAAVYLSFSPTFFRKLMAEGRMPRPRLAGGRRVWDVEELDLAFKALPREGGDERGGVRTRTRRAQPAIPGTICFGKAVNAWNARRGYRNMAYLKLQYVTKDRDRHGNLRFYFRRPGKPKIRLHGLPGSDEFMIAYRAALGESGLVGPQAEKSFEWLCKRYYESGAVQSPGGVHAAAQADGAGRDLQYRSRWETQARPCALCGAEKSACPQTARHESRLAGIRQFSSETNFGAFAWAIKNDLATVNPAEKLEKLGGGSEGYYTWTEQDVETFEAYWPVGSKARLAMSIMLYLGVRRSDAVLIGKKHESRDGLFVTFAQFKGRKKGAKVLTLPILPPLRAILEESGLGNEAWIESMRGAPYAVAGFGNIFKDWCVEAGLLQCSCHGLRKIGAVRAAEAGASEHELMAMFGWEDANMARIYTRKAAQKKMAASGAAKVSLGFPVVPPPVPPHKKPKENNALWGRWCPEEDSNLHALQR